MGVDLQKRTEQLERDGEFHVIVLQRYDGDDGYLATVTSWPNHEDAQGWLTDQYLGFLEDSDRFMQDLLNAHFVGRQFSEIEPALQRYITFNILPIEWHNHMEELGPRVQVFTKGAST
jgi:hypothetical protein